MTLSLRIKQERAIDSLPYEVLVQYSSQTDNVKVFVENAIIESKELEITFLEILLRWTVSVIDTYENEWLGHINYEMQFESIEQQRLRREELREIKAYKKKLEGYLK